MMIQAYVNGHEWLATQLSKSGVGSFTSYPEFWDQYAHACARVMGYYLDLPVG